MLKSAAIGAREALMEGLGLAGVGGQCSLDCMIVGALGAARGTATISDITNDPTVELYIERAKESPQSAREVGIQIREEFGAKPIDADVVIRSIRHAQQVKFIQTKNARKKAEAATQSPWQAFIDFSWDQVKHRTTKSYAEFAESLSKRLDEDPYERKEAQKWYKLHAWVQRVRDSGNAAVMGEVPTANNSHNDISGR